MQRFVARYRIGISRALFAIVVALVLFTRHASPDPGLWTGVSGAVGFMALIVAALGRLWCSIYICGFKTKRVISDGPYSVVRNPLYVFSLIGAVGLGLVTHSLVVLAVLLVLFLGIYPLTVANEEARLEAVLGEEYLAYKARTPRFMPDLTRFTNVETYTINVPQLQSAFLDAIWFPIGFLALETLSFAKQEGLLPVLAYLP